MNKSLDILRKMRSACYDDVDECNRLKKLYYQEFDCPLSFGKLMVVSVKSKIATDVIIVISLILRSKLKLNFEDKVFCLNKMKTIVKRSKIHMHQIEMMVEILDAPKLAEKNKHFYTSVVRGLYNYILR